MPCRVSRPSSGIGSGSPRAPCGTNGVRSGTRALSEASTSARTTPKPPTKTSAAARDGTSLARIDPASIGAVGLILHAAEAHTRSPLMSTLVRHAAAIYHLGARQAARNLLHRATRGTRRLGRYRHAARGLEWAGQARGAFLPHAGGARLEAGQFTAVGRTLAIGDPPDWEVGGAAAVALQPPLLRLARSAAPRRTAASGARLDRALPAERATGRLDAVSTQPAPAPLGDAAVRAGSVARRDTSRVAGLDRGSGRVSLRHTRVPPARQSPARERDHAQAAGRLLPRARGPALGAPRRRAARRGARRAVPARRRSRRALADVPRPTGPRARST